MDRPACLEEEEQKILRTTQLSKWPDFVLIKTLVKTPYWSSTSFDELAEQAPIAFIDNSGSRAFTVNISSAHQLAPLIQLLPQQMSYLAVPKGLLESSVFASSGALRTTFIGLHPELLLQSVLYRLLSSKQLLKA